MIQVQGLTKNYGPRRAIENLSFHADKGEILGFLGPNGAGKTTTMRILTGFMPPTSGRASVAGFDVVDQSLEVRRRVGYMPESVPLYPDMTVFDYLKFMADLRHLRDGEDRVDGVLEQVHMVDRSESYISSLSKGLRQRVGLSQAKRVLESKNYVIKNLNLLSAEGIPEDAAVVVIAGPIYPLEATEVEMLSAFLSSGGAMVLMQDSPIFTEYGDQVDLLAAYLADTWGIFMGQDLIIDQTSFLGYTAPVGVAAINHPISQKIQGVATAFPTARSVQISESGSGAVATELITTASDGSWAETDLETLAAGGDITDNPEDDTLGSVSIAVVAEDFTTGSRVVVFGDVNFVMNANFTFFGNGDLFVGAVDWAVGQEDLITLTPNTSIERYMLPPQPYLLNLILLFVVILLPGTVLVTGIVVWAQKRRRG